MSMTAHQISEYVRAYLRATDCEFREESPHHVTVKLSPQADRELTNRPYYWAYVDRCKVEPETMSYTFVFDPEQYDSAFPAETPQVDSVLNRHFGAVRPLPILGPNRIQREDLTFGSPKLKQLFEAAKRGGSYLYAFEDPGHKQRMTLLPAPYEPWLGVCFKAEFASDMKREELHYYGISLTSGILDLQFGDTIAQVNLLHRLPENISIIPTSMTLAEGKQKLEQQLLDDLERLDYSWADQARARLGEELAIVDSYYSHLLEDDNEEAREGAKKQHEARREEIKWQFDPRIQISAINCGIFHLRSGLRPRT
jgi:hypothetical protein